MNSDFKELLSALNAFEARYLIVGGYAVSLHFGRMTPRELPIFRSFTVIDMRLLLMGASLTTVKPYSDHPG
jgi:hypothetical protein